MEYTHNDEMDEKEWQSWQEDCYRAIHGRFHIGDNPYELIRRLIASNNDHHIGDLPTPPGWDAGWPWTAVQAVVDLEKAKTDFLTAVENMPPYEQAELFSGKVRWALLDQEVHHA